MAVIVALRRVLLAVVISGFTSGCIAGIDSGEVKKGSSPAGLRYFLPATYFVVEQTAEGQWDAKLQSAVDRSREYYVQPYAYLASGKTTVEFHPDGTLKSFRLESDSTAVPEAAITAIKDIQLQREQLKREEIDRRAQAGFTAKEKQVMTQGERDRMGDRAVFIYKLEGDKLTGGPPAPATVTFAVPKAEAPNVPIALGGQLSIQSVDKRVLVGLTGEQLTKDAAPKRLCFYRQVAAGQLVEVDNNRLAGLIEDGLSGSGSTMGGRLSFSSVELWDVQAIGLRGADGTCRPS